MADYLYPAFESGMGETLVRETDDQVLDNDELWQRAIRLQRLLDRVQGLA
jgi:hypothetical protein